MRGGGGGGRERGGEGGGLTTLCLVLDHASFASLPSKHLPLNFMDTFSSAITQPGHSFPLSPCRPFSDDCLPEICTRLNSATARLRVGLLRAGWRQADGCPAAYLRMRSRVSGHGTSAFTARVLGAPSMKRCPAQAMLCRRLSASHLSHAQSRTVKDRNTKHEL